MKSYQSNDRMRAHRVVKIANKYSNRKKGEFAGKKRVMSPLVPCPNPRDPTTWVWGTLLGFFYLNVLFHQNESLKVLVDEKRISNLPLSIKVHPKTY